MIHDAMASDAYAGYSISGVSSDRWPLSWHSVDIPPRVIHDSDRPAYAFWAPVCAEGRGMRRRIRSLWALALAALALVLIAGQLPASALGVAQSSIVSAVPSATTPQILDGLVLDIEQVGSRIVVTGTFTQVQNVAANGGNILDRASVFAFDPTTGAVDTAFAPAVSGTVNAAVPGPNATVYLGGAFSSVNGTTIRNVAQVALATGALTSFRAAATNAAVLDLTVSGQRLFVAGAFTTVGGVAHGGLATLTLTTGRWTPTWASMWRSTTTGPPA